MTPQERDGLIEIVRDVAATEIKPHFRALAASAIDQKSAPDDLVTLADTAAEHALTARFRKLMPDAAVVGEEAISADKSLLGKIGEAGRCIIIDPIDGTWNFAHGSAVYGVIIAVVEEGETVFGLLYDPSFDDWIWAQKGVGTFFRASDGSERRLSVGTAPRDLSDMFGYVGIYLFDQDGREKISASLPRFRRTLALRCSCHQYRHMAQGHAAFDLTGMLNPWDHAAGVLCLREAGGVARLLDGQEYVPTMTQGRLLCTQSEAVWGQLATLWQDVT